MGAVSVAVRAGSGAVLCVGGSVTLDPRINHIVSVAFQEKHWEMGLEVTSLGELQWDAGVLHAEPADLIYADVAYEAERKLKMQEAARRTKEKEEREKRLKELREKREREAEAEDALYRERYEASRKIYAERRAAGWHNPELIPLDLLLCDCTQQFWAPLRIARWINDQV